MTPMYNFLTSGRYFFYSKKKTLIQVVDSLIKNIFDNSLYLSVHEKSLELLKNLIDVL